MLHLPRAISYTICNYRSRNYYYLKRRVGRGNSRQKPYRCSLPIRDIDSNSFLLAYSCLRSLRKNWKGKISSSNSTDSYA